MGSSPNAKLWREDEKTRGKWEMTGGDVGCPYNAEQILFLYTIQLGGSSGIYTCPP